MFYWDIVCSAIRRSKSFPEEITQSLDGCLSWFALASNWVMVLEAMIPKRKAIGHMFPLHSLWIKWRDEKTGQRWSSLLVDWERERGVVAWVWLLLLSFFFLSFFVSYRFEIHERSKQKTNSKATLIACFPLPHGECGSLFRIEASGRTTCVCLSCI